MVTTAWPPGMEESMVSSTRSRADGGVGQVDEEHAGAVVGLRAMTMPTLAPSAPVMKALRPLITQWLPSSRQVVSIIEGSEPAPPSRAGSVMKKAERARPSTSGFRNRSFCASEPTLPRRYMLPSSGAAVLTAVGPRMERPERIST
jgi:hypothetical protein